MKAEHGLWIVIVFLYMFVACIFISAGGSISVSLYGTVVVLLFAGLFTVCIALLFRTMDESNNRR